MGSGTLNRLRRSHDASPKFGGVMRLKMEVHPVQNFHQALTQPRVVARLRQMRNRLGIVQTTFARPIREIAKQLVVLANPQRN